MKIDICDTFVVFAKCRKRSNFVAKHYTFIMVFIRYKFYIYNTYLCLTLLHVILILHFTFLE